MNQLKHFRVWLLCSGLAALAAGCDTANTGAVSADSKSAGVDEPADRTELRTAEPLVKVTPIHPVRKTLVRWVEQSGQLGANEETPLYARLTGYVQKIHVDMGDLVTGPQLDEQGKVIREGQLLIELSIPDLDEEYQQKEAALGQARAELQQASAAIKVARAAEASARAKVEEAESVVEQTQADYEFAASEFARLKKLADRGSVTQEVADEKQKLLRTADSARKQTQARIASARATVTEKRALIEKADADQEAAQKRLVAAAADLERVKALQTCTKIRAPYDGIVTARNVHTGHLVQPGTRSGGSGKPLLEVAQIRVLRIFVDVPEADAASIAEGAVAEVRITSEPAESRQGTVKRTAWGLNSETRTLRTEVDLDNADGQLRPGMYARVRLKVAERPDVLALPKGAVQTIDGTTYCSVIKAKANANGDSEGAVVRMPIEIGIRAGNEIEIVSGLSGDEQIIGLNAAAFHEGQKVQVEPAK